MVRVEGIDLRDLILTGDAELDSFQPQEFMPSIPINLLVKDVELSKVSSSGTDISLQKREHIFTGLRLTLNHQKLAKY